MRNPDAIGHVTGRSIYLDDIPLQRGTLCAVVFPSPAAYGRIIDLDIAEASALQGVQAVFRASDIPGENQIGGIIPDEPLLAREEVHYCGQPVALVVAENEQVARQALKLIKINIEKWKPVTDPRTAKELGLLLIPPRIFQSGDVENAWGECEYIFEGRTETGGQEHLYIETQGAYACPAENGSLRIHSSTQGPTAVQNTAAKVLGIPMHRIEVDVTRLGGGFGGKEDQATGFACLAALAAFLLKRPVKLSLHRLEDMRMTGKRHPYSADFKIGLSKDLRILAYQATFYQNGGAAADLSPAIIDRTLFHATNVYYVPNTRLTAYSCKTHLPPNTAFRGFGGPQGMFVIEAAIAKAARELNIPAWLIQQANFMKEQDAFHYGQLAWHVNIGKCYAEADRQFDIGNWQKQLNEFNENHLDKKKGLSVMPVCFGISFTNKRMNQARALVHIYQDGSVGISTAAVEMGQGVNAKICQVAAMAFSIAPERIKLETTNTTRVANTSPTAASSGADLNGKATEIACARLLERLKTLAAEMLDAKPSDVEFLNEWVHCRGQITDIHWEQLIEKAMQERISLSENGHYFTPAIHFDKETNKGHPFAYHVYGVAITEVTLDCIRGIYCFDKVAVVHDFGNSINMLIDQGQVEGALVQGIGWMTMEELVYNADGRLMSNSLSTYKVPDIYAVPREISIIPLDAHGPDPAIKKSKAVGEPPLMYGIGAYFAIQNAIKAFNPGYILDFDAPMTPEKVLMRLYQTTPA